MIYFLTIPFTKNKNGKYSKIGSYFSITLYMLPEIIPSYHLQRKFNCCHRVFTQKQLPLILDIGFCIHSPHSHNPTHFQSSLYKKKN